MTFALCRHSRQKIASPKTRSKLTPAVRQNKKRREKSQRKVALVIVAEVHTFLLRRRSSLPCAMQYYTKQELQGAGRYTGKCRIGNWNENDTLDEVRKRNSRPFERMEKSSSFLRPPHLFVRILTCSHLSLPPPPQVRLKDYIAKKEMGSLKMDKFQKRMTTALQKVRQDTRRGRGGYVCNSRDGRAVPLWAKMARCFFGKAGTRSLQQDHESTRWW